MGLQARSSLRGELKLSKERSTRLYAILALVCVVVTALWLGFLIAGMARNGPISTFEQALSFVSRQDVLFYASYLNAALITLIATALMTGLYLFCRPAAPEWSLIGLVFVPVYCLMNMVVYLSQITLIPLLVQLRQTAEAQAAVDVLLSITVQAYPGSIIGYFNNLAYALLGIPSIIFGVILIRKSPLWQITGWLLALNGIACLLGIFGITIHNSFLSLGSLAGGVLFLVALFPLSLAFWRETPAPHLIIK